MPFVTGPHDPRDRHYGEAAEADQTRDRPEELGATSRPSPDPGETTAHGFHVGSGWGERQITLQVLHRGAGLAEMGEQEPSISNFLRVSCGDHEQTLDHRERPVSPSIAWSVPRSELA